MPTARGAVGKSTRVGDKGSDSFTGNYHPYVLGANANHFGRGSTGSSIMPSGPRQISAINGLSVQLVNDH